MEDINGDTRSSDYASYELDPGVASAKSAVTGSFRFLS